MGWLARLLGDRVPGGFTVTLEPDEYVIASAETGAGPVVATPIGLWVPAVDGHRRIGWHEINKAVWGEGQLSIVAAHEIGRAGEAVLISDARAVRFPLDAPGKLPPVVRQRVDGSILQRYRKDLPEGGAWFVLRKPFSGPRFLQVRPDAGVVPDTVADIAREAAEVLARSDT